MVPGAVLPKLAECRYCHEPIRFVRMNATGRNMPVNPAPREPHDNHPGVVAARLNGPALFGHVITLDNPAGAQERYLFTPHYATCTRPGRKPQPPPTEPDTALF